MSSNIINTIRAMKSRKKKVAPTVLQTLIAELPSSYSDLPSRQLKIKYRTANEALSVVYLLRYWEPWETEKIIRSIAQKAYLHEYKGKWSTVQEFLEQEDQTPKSFEDKYKEQFGNHAFFGNFLRNTVKILATFDCREVTFADTDTRPVRRPKRKRGYDDKGSLRQKHEDHGVPNFSDKARIDRRQQVNHPLILLEFFSAAVFCDRIPHPSKTREEVPKT